MSYDGPESENNGTFVVNESKDILMNSWRTELNAPEILPYKEELVAEIQEFLSDQETLIAEKVENEDGMLSFTHSLYQMDSQRLRYSLARYLRTRILKIENTLEAIVSDIEMLDRLSFKEKKFAAKLNALNNSHFEDEIFSRLQESLRDTVSDSNDRTLHAAPQLQDFVFVKANEYLTVLIKDQEPLRLEIGDVSVLQYSAVQEYVLADRLLLM